MSRPRQPLRSTSDRPTAGATKWLWILLAISTLTLLVQLELSGWLPAIVPLDVRNWTWRGYAVLCTVTIVVLVAIRAWQNSSMDTR